MGPARAIRTGLARSFQFSGRASRSEFWWFAPVGLTFPLLAAFWSPPKVDGWDTLAIKLGVVSLATIPFNAAATRRFQDTGTSVQEFWSGVAPALGLVLSGYLLALAIFGVSTILFALPGLLIGLPAALLFVVCLFLAPGALGATIGQLLVPSSPGPNRYGPPPSEVTP